jgi:hypothetical protein
MGFLKRRDYEQTIKSEHLNQLLGQNLDYALEQDQNAAIVEASAYLRVAYDVDKILLNIPDWSADKSYLKDDYVWYNDNIYKALVDIPGAGSNAVTPTIDSSWQLDDPRDAKLLQVIIDITLYHAHKRVSPTQVPHHRLLSHAQALEYLKMLSQGALNANLPDIEDPSLPITFKGRSRECWMW